MTGVDAFDFPENFFDDAVSVSESERIIWTLRCFDPRGGGISKPGLKIHTATQTDPPPRPCATRCTCPRAPQTGRRGPDPCGGSGRGGVWVIQSCPRWFWVSRIIIIIFFWIGISIVVHFLEHNCSCDLVSCNASPINNQGHFHVPIAPNERKVHVVLESRHWFTPATLYFKCQQTSSSRRSGLFSLFLELFLIRAAVKFNGYGYKH